MAFHKAYSVHDKEGYLNAFKKDGFVVIDDILTAEECELSCGEVWDFLEMNGKVKRDDPMTWGNDCWPREVCRNGGFVGRFPFWKRMKKLDQTRLNKQPQSWRNRENPKMYQVFADILNDPKLWVSIDRYGVMRPAKVASEVDEEQVWQTKKEWLHWDLSPFHYGTSAAGFAPNDTALDKDQLKKSYGSTLRLQGLLVLRDCPVENGGFHCVPGFTDERFFQWADANRDTYGALPEIATRNFIEVPDDDPMRKEIRQVPIKAGSLLIWNSQLPHGNFPNESHDFRMVQYIKMIPSSDQEFTPAMQLDRFEASEWFPEEFTPSTLGKRLLGLEEWP
ncbi:hypothetical protein THRCLA_10777 [Thraustotheca clavata]|uniref:Phytanoyl-CoA dioxygenase n=1 Tax=Thraustotheca clavata TaxID=74557 RepID=A0A1V9YHB1_9STRA|nr:hypothetical protein THRCLA_10777 [Thraustotheca clavata]